MPNTNCWKTQSQTAPTYSQSILIFWVSKWIKPNSLKPKKPEFLSFFGLKGSWHKIWNVMPQFLLKIRQDECLGFVHIPDIGPIPFQIIGQKLVGRLIWRLSLAQPHIYNAWTIIFMETKGHNINKRKIYRYRPFNKKINKNKFRWYY